MGRHLPTRVGFFLAIEAPQMPHWNRILIFATLVALGPAFLARSRAGNPHPADRADVEDALLLRLGDALDSSASAERNAATMAAGLRDELRGCGAVQVTGPRISVEGEGCKLADGLRLSEPITLVVHRSARGLTIVMTAGGDVASASASAGRNSSGDTVTAQK